MILLDLIRHLLEWFAGLLSHVPVARALFGSVLILVLPGFFWMLALFPGKLLNIVERIALSFGLSVAVTTLSIFAVNRLLGMRITGSNSVLVVLSITVVPLLWLTGRKLLRGRGQASDPNSGASRTSTTSSSEVIHRILTSDWLKLLPILGLAFYVAFIPHLNYRFPVHLDEWVHMADARAIQQANDLTYLDPFNGAKTLTPWVNLETGFHLLLATFQSITGISWMNIFVYSPACILMTTVLGVYALAGREGFGWEAALLTALLPTTAGILGPAFLVPVAMGLAFVPLSLFAVFHLRGCRGCAVLLVFNIFLLSMHAPSGVVLVLILAPYIIGSLNKDKWYAMGMAAALLAPFIALAALSNQVLPAIFALLEPTEFSAYHELPLLIPKLGYASFGLSLAGVVVLTVKGGIRKISLLLGLVAVLLMLIMFFVFQFGVPILFYRGLLFAMLMMALIGGAGLMAIRQFRLPQKDGLVTTRNTWRKAGFLLFAAIVVATLATEIPVRQKEPYYHMITEEEFLAFTWIANNVPAEYQGAIVDPWKATAFTAITLKSVYTNITVAPTINDQQAYEFLKNGAVDAVFLRRKDSTIVYSVDPVLNPDLVQVRKNVYLLKKR